MPGSKSITSTKMSTPSEKLAVSAPSRVLELWYVKDLLVDTYDSATEYHMVSAMDAKVKPEPELVKSGVDIGLFRLHIHNAEERRKVLGIVNDKNYEIMVSFSLVHVHGKEKNESLTALPWLLILITLSAIEIILSGSSGGDFPGA